MSLDGSSIGRWAFTTGPTWEAQHTVSPPQTFAVESKVYCIFGGSEEKDSSKGEIKEGVFGPSMWNIVIKHTKGPDILYT